MTERRRKSTRTAKSRKPATAKKAPKGKTGAAPRKVRGRTLAKDKIAKRMSRAGKSTVNVKTAVFTVEVIDDMNADTIEGIIVGQNPNVVNLRHKRSRGGQRMRVSSIPQSDVIAVYGDAGEAGSVIVRRPKVIHTCSGNITHEKGFMIVTSDVTGEVTRIPLGRPDIRINAFVDEDSTSKSTRGAKKRRAAKADDEDFED